MPIVGIGAVTGILTFPFPPLFAPEEHPEVVGTQVIYVNNTCWFVVYSERRLRDPNYFRPALFTQDDVPKRFDRRVTVEEQGRRVRNVVIDPLLVSFELPPAKLRSAVRDVSVTEVYRRRVINVDSLVTVITPDDPPLKQKVPAREVSAIEVHRGRGYNDALYQIPATPASVELFRKNKPATKLEPVSVVSSKTIVIDTSVTVVGFPVELFRRKYYRAKEVSVIQLGILRIVLPISSVPDVIPPDTNCITYVIESPVAEDYVSESAAATSYIGCIAVTNTYAIPDKACPKHDGSYFHDGIIAYGVCVVGEVVAFDSEEPITATMLTETPMRVCI